MKAIKIIVGTVLSLTAFTTFAAPIKGLQKNPTGLNKTAAGCNQTTAVIDLDINNVRARLMNGGDMWWDRPNATAAYEVPKNSNKNSLFAGSIWIGGIDRASGDLKVAAQTYRQSGNDYWAGPLDETNGYSITFQTCSDWDRFWKINAADITKFREIYQTKNDLSEIQQAIQDNISSVPEIIKDWPAKGNQFIKSSANAPMAAPKREMADYVNVDGIDGYDWRNGDYPAIVGDQYIWWVFNDRGDVKTETTSEAIGLEIHAAAFAFSTNDCLNEATFYDYKVYNFSTSPLDSTYMATWCDADLGYAFDDYVGCDTVRGLGVLYNGDAYDEGPGGYGFEIPMVAVDYFQGPKYFNTQTQKDTQIRMTVFTYFNNVTGPTGNPDVKDDYYQYITGSWKDGQPFTTACNARDAGISTKYIFYGEPCKGGWSEASCANTPDDRRFIHSSGPFPLIPGAEPNDIIIGAVWVPNIGGGKAACFSKIQVCDDKAQNLFDNNFKLPFGPQAPSANVLPLDRKLVFDIDNLETSNNFGEGYGTNLNDAKYREVSPKAILNGSPDSLYKFEGYIVYQLKNEFVSSSSIRQKDGSINTDVARIVFQCDKKNGIKDILNFEVDPEISTDYYVPKLMVSGQDSGIKHTFALTQDAFATGTSKSLVNYKTYYYLVVAYAHNNFKQFDPNNFGGTQDLSYLESRTNGRGLPIQVIKAMPHPANDSLYVQNYSDYGTGIQLKRIEGIGNGGIPMELTPESEVEALGPNSKSPQPTYMPNFGPVDLKVVHPNLVKAGNYEIWLKVDSAKSQPFSIVSNGVTIDTTSGAIPSKTRWFIVNTTTGDTAFSQVDVTEYNEQYLRKYNAFDWGLSASVTQQPRPGDQPLINDNGLIRSSVTYADINNAWLSGVRDQDGVSFNNWIRSGNATVTTNATVDNCNMDDIANGKDPNNNYEDVISGTFAPYNLVNNVNTDICRMGLFYGNDSRTRNRLEEVYSIDLVFTSDRSKWSRAAVIEMTEHIGNTPYGENGAFKYTLRKHEGWNGDVNPSNDQPIYSTSPSDSGMSYFPGYAINIETGERLNIAFGEESFNAQDRGNDMLWNPTSRSFDAIDSKLKWGGKHIIYVLRSKYDGCAAFANVIRPNSNNASDKATADGYRAMMWVGVPLLAPGSAFASNKDGIIPTDTRLSVRVTRPYTWYKGDDNQSLRNNGWPLYSFTTNGIAPAKLGDANNNYTSNKDEIFKRIHVVPNPYYAYSQYENSRVENRVRIINLPEKATIKIFTLDGALIKTLVKNDAATTYIDWDIKNDKNIPIASGLYLVHVNIPGVGETVLKWFGAMRPTDLTSF
jgi:hypothetical protein